MLLRLAWRHAGELVAIQLGLGWAGEGVGVVEVFRLGAVAVGNQGPVANDLHARKGKLPDVTRDRHSRVAGDDEA